MVTSFDLRCHLDMKGVTYFNWRSMLASCSNGTLGTFCFFEAHMVVLEEGILDDCGGFFLSI